MEVTRPFFDFEIRYAILSLDVDQMLIAKSLDDDVIVLHGAHSEAASPVLQGLVVLRLPGPLHVKEVYLRIAGKWRIG
jgi:hypothetical protein